MTTGVSRRVKEGSFPIALGSTLERKYELREVLGQGHTGVVYLAHDRSLERDVSVKVLRPSYAANKEVASYFRQEAVALARVRHENVVQIFTFGEHQGLPYFVMEYLPGGTVARQQRETGERGLSLDAALSILDQVCQGLQAVHDSGVVHRDIKPANMLIGAPFRVAVADFGLVRTTDSTGATQEIIGTPLYVAPELIEGQELSEGLLNRCDIYSLGVSAFELLTGRRPFEGDTIQQLFEAHLDSPRRGHLTSTWICPRPSIPCCTAPCPRRRSGVRRAAPSCCGSSTRRGPGAAGGSTARSSWWGQTIRSSWSSPWR